MLLKVFVSYAREDGPAAVEFYNWLLTVGVDPWIDQKFLLPGQNWPMEIERAFSEANVIVLLMSPRSVSKRGFVQREANQAFEKLIYKLPTDVYVIPVVLEQCEVPSHIAGRLQYVDWSIEGARDQVAASLVLAAEQQSVELASGSELGQFRLFPKVLEERWEAQPGHDIRLNFPFFTSQNVPQLASELNEYISGIVRATVITSREKPWEQSPEFYSEPGEFVHTNGRWDEYGVTFANDELLSIVCDVHWYGAGAAHPNSHFETHNFSMRDRLIRLTLRDFFSDFDGALNAISRLCIEELSREFWARTGSRPDEEDVNWFSRGAGPEEDNFSAFTISAEGLTFLIPPYQVASYALGRWSVSISYYDLLDYLNVNGPYASLAKRVAS